MHAEDAYFHHGLMAELNNACNSDEAPEIDYFLRVIEERRTPALDAGCGPGRLLRRCLRAGLDVEGSDISHEMLAICRRRAEVEGLAPTLHLQSTARLDLPRRYRTIVLSGSFGLNGTRADDEEALRRIRRHLVPGGTIALDVEAGWAMRRAWERCASPERALPAPWEPGGPAPTADGDVITTSTRIVRADGLAQEFVEDVRCDLLRDGALVRSEVHRLVARWYAPRELVAMLGAAGFTDVRVTGDYRDEPLTADHRMHVYEARAA